MRIYLDNILWMIRHNEINHYYYMYGLDRKDASDMDHYLGKKEFNRYRNTANNGLWVEDRLANYICLLSDKFLFAQYLESLGFNTPNILALCDRNTITWPDNGQIEPLQSLTTKPDMDFFLKDILGECADGVYPIKLKNSQLYHHHEKIDIDQLTKLIKDKSILQQRIEQHSKINELYAGSVNTIRLVTASNPKGIFPLAAILRIGVKGQCRDNLSAGGIAVSVGLKTGKLGKYGFLRPDFGRKELSHPDTKTVFEGFDIPFFTQVIEKACELHTFFYGLRCIGWDIAITENGPVFIEGNHNWEVPTFQTFDCNFKTKFLDALTEE